MTKLKNMLLGLAVLYGIGASAVHAAPAMPRPLKAEKPAKIAPALVFTDDKGARHSLAQYRGRYLLLNMWATWCAPCVAELPALAKLKAAAPNITVLAVDLTGRKETPARAESYLRDHHVAALGANVDTQSMFMRSFIVAVMPTTVLVDPAGKVVARAEGPAEWASPASAAYFQSLR